MSAPTTNQGGQDAGVVTVWWAHRSLAAALDDALLSDAERTRVGRLRGRADRERSLVARGVLRLAVASLLPDHAEDLAIDWEHGPVLPGSLGIWASVSHSDDAVAIAVSGAGPIGVDVEALRRVSDLVPAVQEAVFTPAERDELHALPATDRLPAALRLWTLKEAVLKSTGDGLVRAPSTIELSGLVGPARLDRFDERDDLVGAVHLFDLAPTLQPYVVPGEEATAAFASPVREPGGYVASLALFGGPAQIVERDAGELLG